MNDKMKQKILDKYQVELDRIMAVTVYPSDQEERSRIAGVLARILSTMRISRKMPVGDDTLGVKDSMPYRIAMYLHNNNLSKNEFLTKMAELNPRFKSGAVLTYYPIEWKIPEHWKEVKKIEVTEDFQKEFKEFKRTVLKELEELKRKLKLHSHQNGRTVIIEEL